MTEASTGYWKKPLAGDEVNVHFVGTLEVASEFSQEGQASNRRAETGSSHPRVGQVSGAIKQGEMARFTLSQEFASEDPCQGHPRL